MNSKTDTTGSMGRLFSGLVQVNQPREQVPEGTAEEAGEEREAGNEGQETPSHLSEQSEEEITLPQTDTNSNEYKPSKTRTKCHNPKEQFLFRVEKRLLEKTRQISYLHDLSISDIMNYALGNFIASYEEKYGTVKKKGNKISIDKLL